MKNKIQRSHIVPRDKGVFDVFANGRHAGGVDLTFEARRAVVSRIRVAPSDRGEGSGTLLYEAALAAACKEGIPLSSDDYRSRFAEAFWRKQHRKGRAVCTKREDGADVYGAPVTEILHELRRGCLRQRYDAVWAERCAQAKLKAMTATLPEPSWRPGTGKPYWPCACWTIPLSKCGSSLDGLRGRRRT
jgi:hypothetical protein